jgi:uncharacterized membrane protein
MLSFLQGAALTAATMTMGLMAGVFGIYAHAVMPGLDETDDRTFIGAFQAVDRAFMNPLFMLWFLGALAFSGLAAALHLGGAPSVLPWIAAAVVLYAVVFVITIAVHVPLNDALKAAGEPDRIADLAAVRERFDAARWASWNVVRAIATTAAFGCLCWGLVQYGRTVLGP